MECISSGTPLVERISSGTPLVEHISSGDPTNGAHIFRGAHGWSAYLQGAPWMERIASGDPTGGVHIFREPHWWSAYLQGKESAEQMWTLTFEALPFPTTSLLLTKMMQKISVSIVRDRRIAKMFWSAVLWLGFGAFNCNSVVLYSLAFPNNL